MVRTEDRFIAGIARRNEHILLGMLWCDENLEYHGSIPDVRYPKYSQAGGFCRKWYRAVRLGVLPTEAQALRDCLQASSLDARQLALALIGGYEARGWW